MFTRSAWILLSLLAMGQQRANPPAQAQEFRISGIVEDAVSGLPLEAAEVSIAPSGLPLQDAVAPVLTSLDGRFVFEHVPAGKYVHSAKRRGYAPQNYDAHEGFTTAIAVGPPLDSENIVFKLLPAAGITGQVIDDFGEAVRRAEVILCAEGRADGRTAIRRQAQTQTDDQGRYRFGGLPKGRYYVVVSARPWYAQNITAETMAGRPAQDPNRPITSLRQVVEQNASLDVVYPVTYYSGTTDSARASIISLEPGETVTANVSLTAVPALHIRLMAPGLDLSQSLNVSVAQVAFGQPFFLETPQAWRESDSIGIVGVPPGEVKINAQSGGDSKTPILFNATVNTSQGLEINLNHQAHGIPVSGTVTASGGAHLPERTFLLLRDPATGRSGQAAIKPDGSFDFFDFLTPGRYALSTIGGSGWYVGGVRAEGAQVSGRVVDLQSADPVRLSVEISEGLGRVEGVALRDSKGMGGVMILLVSKDLLGGASVVGHDQSDSDGTFTIFSVPPGEYTLLAIQNGWDQEWGDPSVLQKWLGGGESAKIAPNGRASVRVNVQ